MNLYLIDYENVTDTGFMGVKELTAEDTVTSTVIIRRIFLLSVTLSFLSLLLILNTLRF